MTICRWTKQLIGVGIIALTLSVFIASCSTANEDDEHGALYVNNLAECDKLDQYHVSDTLAMQLNKLARAQVLTEDYIKLFNKIDSTQGENRVILNYVLGDSLDSVQLKQLLVCCYAVKGRPLIVSEETSWGYIDLNLTNGLNLKLDSLKEEGLLNNTEDVVLDNNFDVLMITRPTSVTFINFGTEEAYVNTHFKTACSNLYQDGKLLRGGFIILNKESIKK